MGKVVKVKQIPVEKREFDTERILAAFCYYYPAYTYKAAKKMPYRRVKLMLDEALKQRNMNYITLTRIIAAPHTKGMKMVNELIKQFQEQING